MADEEQKRIFAKNLNKYLSMFNKTQKEVADAIDVSPQTFNTWCQGIALPRMGKVQRLADYFGIKKTDLIDEKTETSNSILSAKDQRDIAKDLNRIMGEIRKKDSGPLYYNGVEISDASTNLLQNAIEFALKETKVENKAKYNPHKNKK